MLSKNITGGEGVDVAGGGRQLSLALGDFYPLRTLFLQGVSARFQGAWAIHVRPSVALRRFASLSLPPRVVNAFSRTPALTSDLPFPFPSQH